MHLKYKGTALNNNNFETRAEFFLFGEMQVHLDEGGGIILLGDNTRGGAVRQQPRSGSSVLEYGFLCCMNTYFPPLVFYFNQQCTIYIYIYIILTIFVL